MTLPEKIKLLANEKKVSFAEIERHVGISNGQIRRWGFSSPKIENVQKVADYFDVSVDYLLGRTEKKDVEITENKDIKTIAAHVADKNRKLSEEELEDIKNYIDFLVSKHDKK